MLRKIKEFIHLNPILRGDREDWSLLHHHLDTGGHTAHLVFCSTFVNSFITGMEILNLDTTFVNYPGEIKSVKSDFFQLPYWSLTWLCSSPAAQVVPVWTTWPEEEDPHQEHTQAWGHRPPWPPWWGRASWSSTEVHGPRVSLMETLWLQQCSLRDTDTDHRRTW